MIEYSYDPPYNLWSGNRSDTLNKWKINYKGSIATASALPEKGEFKGDTYNVLEDGSNYMWNGSSWDKLDANVYVGATSNKSGIQGLVPPASSSERNKFLRGDGTYKDVAWDMIVGKPLTFTPSAHTHDWSDITNELDFALNNEVVHVYNNAGSHNSIYRGKDLTNIYSVNDLHEKLSEGDFSDLYVGDFITKHLTISYSAELDGETISVSCDEDFNFRIAHFDYWYDMGDTALNQHHIVFVPDKPFFKCKMRKTNTTEGGVPASNVWGILQTPVYNALQASSVFNGKILTFRDWIPDSVNTNAPSAVGANFIGSTVYTNTMWRDVKCGILHEPMVYGGAHFSSSGYDTGCGTSQLALFQLEPAWIHCGSSSDNYWLCAVSSVSLFAFAAGIGVAHFTNAANTNVGIRPFFLIG